MATSVVLEDFEKFAPQSAARGECAPMCADERGDRRKQVSMAVSFFGGVNGAGSRVWSASGTVNEQDHDELLARVHELESLCTEVLVAGVDIGLPQRLLNRLWGAVGHGELPHAFHVDLPPASAPAAAPVDVAPVVNPLAAEVAAAEMAAKPEPAAASVEPMQIPDIPLSSNPFLAKDDSQPKPPQTELKPITSKKTVAVVDDDPMMLDVLSRILQRENFELLMASGGPEIMEKLTEHGGAIDLLVTDYAMPEMQGRELAEHVRQRYPSVKVLYQTGFSDMLFENCMELEEGAAFLEKPFTARGLREAARLVLFGAINP
jgi:CheY-like chemotaxis protein